MAWFATAPPVVRREARPRRRRGRVVLHFPRYSDLRGAIESNTLYVKAVRHRLSHVLLDDVPCRPIVTREGVICGYCQPGTVFPDHEALWCDHIFDELINVAQAIANSVGLALTINNGRHQAWLMRTDDLRDMSKMAGPNDGTRTLTGSVMSHEVLAALDDWRRTGFGGVLIGTLAYGFYAKPRFEDEVALLVSDGFGAPEVVGFDVVGQRSLVHRETGTRLWLLTPSALRLSIVTMQHILATTVASDGVTLASPSGLVAILLGNRRARASADIVGLLQHGQVDVRGYGLPDEHLRRLERLRAEADEESRRATEWKVRTGEPW